METSIISFALLFTGRVLAEGMSPSEYFPELTDKTFSDAIKQSGMSLVMFLAPWCGHCKKLHPEVEIAAQKLQKSPYPLLVGQVDCTNKGKKTCEKNSITGYPTLKIFKGKKFWREYDGPRTANGIVEYMKNQVRPCPAEIKNEANLAELTKNDNAYVGFFKKGTKDSVLKDIFLKLADEQRGTLRMGISEVPEMIEKHCPQHGLIFVRNKLLRSKFEPDEVVYDGEETKEAVEKWMKDVKHGIVGLRSTDNVRDFPPPVVVAYYDVDYERGAKTTNYWRNRVLKVALKYKDDFKFAISSKFDFPSDFASFGYNFVPGIVKEPIILARTPAGKFKLGGNFTVDAFDDFLQNLKTGQLQPFVKSEEPPKKESKNPAKIVVASTFDEMVLNSGKDSFILFHSSKCHKCQKFQAAWYDLAKELEGEDVDILRFDYSKNDVPKNFDIVGPFTIYWLPKNDKSHPIRYGEAQSYPTLLFYVCKFATVELKHRDRKGKLKKSEL